MSEREITIKFDLGMLASYTDEFLAFLWHLAQHNPAPHGDPHAGDLASRVGAEIIQRWLKNAPVEMYRHQQRDYHWSELSKLAKYEPPAGARSTEDGWYEGVWVPKSAEGGAE